MKNKNKDKYLDEFIEVTINKGCCGYIKEKILKKNSCANVKCSECAQKVKDWFEQECIELPKTVWDLKEGDKYYFLNDIGVISVARWNNNKSDINTRNQGNAFLTKEEAEYEKRRREVYTIVKKYAHEFNREEWKNGAIRKWVPCANSDFEIDFNNYVYDRMSILYFKSIEDIQAAIAEVSKEDFLRYYLGVAQ